VTRPTQPIDPPVAELAAAGDNLALVADLGRATADSRKVTLVDIADGVVARILRSDEALHVESFECYADQPRRPRGTATLHDPIAFAEYTERLGDLGTTLWADQPQARVTAVYNDHLDPKTQEDEALTAGWRGPSLYWGTAPAPVRAE
jgi:hypothetical protein